MGIVINGVQLSHRVAGAGHGQLGGVFDSLYLVFNDGVTGRYSTVVAKPRVDANSGGSLSASELSLLLLIVKAECHDAEKREETEYSPWGTAFDEKTR